MKNVLYPFPRTFSYNMACDKVEELFNPDYRDIWNGKKEFTTPVKAKSINDNVTFFYINGELIAMYDEISGDLWTTKEVA